VLRSIFIENFWRNFNSKNRTIETPNRNLKISKMTGISAAFVTTKAAADALVSQVESICSNAQITEAERDRYSAAG